MGGGGTEGWLWVASRPRRRDGDGCGARSRRPRRSARLARSRATPPPDMETASDSTVRSAAPALARRQQSLRSGGQAPHCVRRGARSRFITGSASPQGPSAFEGRPSPTAGRAVRRPILPRCDWEQWGRGSAAWRSAVRTMRGRPRATWRPWGTAACGHRRAWARARPSPTSACCSPPPSACRSAPASPTSGRATRSRRRRRRACSTTPTRAASCSASASPHGAVDPRRHTSRARSRRCGVPGRDRRLASRARTQRDRSSATVPRLLAALRPRMLELAAGARRRPHLSGRRRTLRGPGHPRPRPHASRRGAGDRVLDPDPARARARARAHLDS